jgi:pilus assembly protein Flp/PilA
MAQNLPIVGLARHLAGNGCAGSRPTLGRLREVYPLLAHLITRPRGQGLVEYALILALVAVVVIAILIVLGPAIGSIFSNIQQSL